MTNEGQSSKITLAVFLKISKNPMSATCILFSCFLFCLLACAMNRTMENMRKQLIVIESQTV